MAILILNIGSQTIKWAVYNRQWKEEGNIAITNFDSQLKDILNKIRKKYSINLIAHRIVHGGERKNCFVDLKLMKYLESLEKFATLHQKYELKGIKASGKIFNNAKQAAIFDTSFHSTIPEKAKIYAIPYKFYEKGIKRYGFHGSSHRYVSEKVSELMKRKNFRLVSCHLGAGCSVTAIENGKSVDTSMGFTPMEGIMMLTRSGSIDPGIIIYLKNENLNEILNEKSGIYGICGQKNFRKVLKSKNKKAKLAIEMFCYSAAKQIGAYASVMKGLDAVAFTGGIGENSGLVRKKILDYIKFLKPKVFIIKADEKEIMLKEALKL